MITLHNAFSGNPKQSKLGFLTQFFPCPPGGCMRYRPVRKKPGNVLLSDDRVLADSVSNAGRTDRTPNGNLVKANPSLKIGLGGELPVSACRLFLTVFT